MARSGSGGGSVEPLIFEFPWKWDHEVPLCYLLKKIFVSNLYFLILTFFFFHVHRLWKFTTLFSNDLVITYSNDKHIQTRP